MTTTQDNTLSDGSKAFAALLYASAEVLDGITIISKTGISSSALREVAVFQRGASEGLAIGETSAWAYDRPGLLSALMATSVLAICVAQRMGMDVPAAVAMVHAKVDPLTKTDDDYADPQEIVEQILALDFDEFAGENRTDPAVGQWAPVDLSTAMRSLAAIMSSDPGYASSWKAAIVSAAVRAGVSDDAAQKTADTFMSESFADLPA